MSSQSNLADNGPEETVMSLAPAFVLHFKNLYHDHYGGG